MFGEKNKDMETQAQKLEALGQFAGGIAHDFNNILSIIEGYTHLAIKGLKEGTLSPEQLQKILTSTQRGAGLTRQLLSFGRQKIDVNEKIDLRQTVAQQRVLLHPLLGEDVQLYMSLPDRPLWLNGTEDQMTQIVLNLALNARDAMGGKGEIALIVMACPLAVVPLSLREKSSGREFLRISVIDSGQGIPADILPRIFDPFFTTKGQGQGTGLGLSVVFGIVDQLGGCIEVTSEEGKGAAFDIFLPVSSPPQDILQGRGAHERGTSLEGKTVLLAEDEGELRHVLALMLSDMKMKVLTASNGNHALLVQEEYDGTIDFLLTDVVMPEMDGARLGELFTSLRPQANVVYMSGYPFMDGQRRVNLPEQADFIAKPLQEEKIRKVLERALQRQQERQAREGAENGASTRP